VPTPIRAAPIVALAALCGVAFALNVSVTHDLE
jgi:hypothetical protein